MLPAGPGRLEEEQLLSRLPRALRETGEEGQGHRPSRGPTHLAELERHPPNPPTAVSPGRREGSNKESVTGSPSGVSCSSSPWDPLNLPQSNYTPHGRGYWRQWAVPPSTASAPSSGTRWAPPRQAGRVQPSGADLLFAGAQAPGKDLGPISPPVPGKALLSLSRGVGPWSAGSRKAQAPWALCPQE